jgi:hypothetical protein
MKLLLFAARRRHVALVLSSNGVILSMDLSLLKLQVTLSRCSYDFDNNFFLGEPRDRRNGQEGEGKEGKG